MPRPRSPHPPKHPLWPLLLVGVLAGCGETVTGKDRPADCLDAGCPDAAETDGALAPTGRRTTPGEEVDGAFDLSGDRAPFAGPGDALPPDVAPVAVDAADGGPLDVSVMV